MSENLRFVGLNVSRKINQISRRAEQLMMAAKLLVSSHLPPTTYWEVNLATMPTDYSLLAGCADSGADRLPAHARASLARQ
jgi:hypothetical protein